MKKDTVKPDKVLSASRIKTLQTCSWMYYCSYVLKIPQRSNSGAMRGTVCHLIFELLLKGRHKHHFDSITKENHLEGSASVNRLVIKHLKHQKIYDEENYDLVNKMVLVGLNFDFFCEGAEILEPEYRFMIESEKPKYKITGFMDKPAIYRDKKMIKIIDYKSSKAKFRGDELQSNVQAMMYSLASRTLWPDLKPVIQFMFIRFNKQPLQELEFTDAQLKGFAYSLGELYKIINEFDDKSAMKNFAVDSKENKWLCKVGSWKCPYLEAFEYYSVIDAEGTVKRSSFDKNSLKADENQKIVKQRYLGCPAHKQPNQ